MLKTTLHHLLQKARGVKQVAAAVREDARQKLRRVNTHRDFTPFIILGRSRSGSNFLRGLLNSHPQVVAFGELFQQTDAISWGLSGYGQTPELLDQFRMHPTAFLEAHIFGEAARTVRAQGFKIFYYHAHDAAWQPVWAYLAAQAGLRVIHIKRQNLLKVHLSRKRAQITDRWVNVTGAREQYPPVIVDYEECLRDFQQTKQWERDYAAYFAHHAMLDVDYETLAEDWPREMSRVQEFLDVEIATLTPETFRQSDQELSTAISNFDELEARFRGTEWHPFFTA